MNIILNKINELLLTIKNEASIKEDDYIDIFLPLHVYFKVKENISNINLIQIKRDEKNLRAEQIILYNTLRISTQVELDYLKYIQEQARKLYEMSI